MPCFISFELLRAVRKISGSLKTWIPIYDCNMATFISPIIQTVSFYSIKFSFHRIIYNTAFVTFKHMCMQFSTALWDYWIRHPRTERIFLQSYIYTTIFEYILSWAAQAWFENRWFAQSLSIYQGLVFSKGDYL